MGEMIKVREDNRLDLQVAFRKFEEKYENPSVSVDGVLKEEDFEGKYTPEDILDDKQEVKKKKRDFEDRVKKDSDLQRTAENRKKSEMLGYIFFEMVRYAKMFGENVSAKKTTETDSMRHRIDVVLEVEKKVKNSEENSISHLGVAMDIMSIGSVNGFSEKINSKLADIKKNIELDQLGSLKYFDSDGTADKLVHMPEVFINIEPNVVDELIDLWANNKLEELAKHPVKVKIIHQITTQLQAQENYARSKTVNKIAAADRLKATLDILKDIQTEVDLEFPDVAKDYNEKEDKKTVKLLEGLIEIAHY